MSRFPELASLFAALASNLETLDSTTENEIGLSVSNLNRSLNLREVPKTEILDTVLSLMCFTAPQVYDSVTELTVRTTVTVLKSLIECKVMKNNEDQVLRVGASICKSNFANITEGFVDILGKLRGQKGDLCTVLLYSIIRVAALAPRFQCAIPSNSNLELKSDDGRASSLASLLRQLPNEINIKSGEIPLRLLIWHLDPMILKQDMSDILQEVTERPFLSLGNEIYERSEWRSKLICLVISPSLFVEARALLHNWFLVTGVASIIELQTELVEQVLDIISRPMWWGISMDVGSQLPFSYAYFPYDHHSLKILSGPISHEYFQHLLDELSGSISHAGGHFHTSSKKVATRITIVDHKSMWAMAINFPGWFSFASVILFHDYTPANTSYSRFIPCSAKPYLFHNVEVPSSMAAARYIAWILNPISESYQDLLVDYLVKVSELWALKSSSSNKSNEVKKGIVKETRRLKLHDKDSLTSHELDMTVWHWLRKFKDMYTKVGFSTSDFKGFSTNQILQLRRIPLGILIGYLNHLSAGGCALILHYVATEIIEKLSEKENFGLNQSRRKCDLKMDLVKWTEEYTIAEAVAGCRIVFDITDVIETFSTSIFATEEEGLNFMCQVKLKTGDYLLKCIKRLLQLKFDGDCQRMRSDLLTRVIQWRNKGQDVFQNNMDFDNVCLSLNVQ